ncbi:hypothetical protein NRF20_06820 [Streptomyces sp. R-74717]|uniref:hypothetical protein n=1 Tax=Streptomyces sp. R-74717 TaxID=2969820 RepID=UPI0039B4AB24
MSRWACSAVGHHRSWARRKRTVGDHDQVGPQLAGLLRAAGDVVVVVVQGEDEIGGPCHVRVPLGRVRETGAAELLVVRPAAQPEQGRVGPAGFVVDGEGQAVAADGAVAPGTTVAEEAHAMCGFA